MPLQFKTMNYFRAPGLFHMVRGFWFPVSGGFGNLLSIALTRAPVRYITLGFRKPAETGNRTVGHRPMSAYVATMEITEIKTTADRDQRGRFLAGNNGGGRKPGSRNKLAETFVADLRDCWEKHGVAALEACALEDPTQFVRVIASLMPKTIDLNMSLDVSAFANRFAQAVALLGNDPPPRQIRKPLPGQRIIEHDE
jgi:hypothetical protein